MKLTDRIIVALDNMNEEEVWAFLNKSQHTYQTVKIGLELFYLLGPDFVKKIHHEYNVDIFLDLKLHDIPNTVKKAIRSLKGLPLKFLTVHLTGGRNMLTEALAEASTCLPATNLLGVSFLTSLGKPDFKEIYNFNETQTKLTFSNLFRLALQTNIHGVVLSPLELGIVKNEEQQSGKKLIKVTPGIRFAHEINSNNIQDQQRIATPEDAVKNGADYLVMGRSITSGTPNFLK
ncbi:MAG: orotidine 5'-phosphate decarboxylase [Bdellovibrionales bacterium RIFOXYB1_FULL_37_110]|nr:MAG: orotidine 5'-phosphate decarboxylase [Bdellovibrionales bacterium RIFOXYA1_FULL_38_20]OFZ50205.1 MAG: orotidine 5'-phosphate decarboxylase [Bdellovibrionales bacterium RIFOXYC1_FULL_37_79]OFZ57642.1 MAG: orotidine 5'-phosphate decarboxylase [Bdellovibrionales bacterium RIFOXYB1_FULL_37_110]OFZ61409.1 MAG: orotidine 5'-phosphate decarboxylase [Bdellovibrionales bacterium RIFOXYD1_FULL_36_51]